MEEKGDKLRTLKIKQQKWQAIVSYSANEAEIVAGPTTDIILAYFRNYSANNETSKAEIILISGASVV